MNKADKQRSIQQNSYLWGVVYPTIIDHLPADQINAYTINAENWHDYFCELHFGSIEIGFGGKTRAKRTTTRDERGKRQVLSTTDFMDFVTSIQAECAERGIDIPNPNEIPLEAYAA